MSTEPPVVLTINPCLTCGACCASFRCSFYWGETDAHLAGSVPVELTDEITPFRRAMKGTLGPQVRCIALEGEIGACVSCTIYAQRSSTCRDFTYSGYEGIQNERCDDARARHGLPPLMPEIPEAEPPLPDMPVAA